MSLRDELLELEHGFWDAAGDGGFYEDNMAPDGLFVLPVGILDKDATVASVDGTDPWTSYEVDDVQAVVFGDDAVALCYRASAQRGDDEYRGWSRVPIGVTPTGGCWWSTIRRQSDRQPQVLSVPHIPTTRLHAFAGVDWALADEADRPVGFVQESAIRFAVVWSHRTRIGGLAAMPSEARKETSCR